eukprot:2598950-Prymnesium_polylepis.1
MATSTSVNLLHAERSASAMFPTADSTNPGGEGAGPTEETHLEQHQQDSNPEAVPTRWTRGAPELSQEQTCARCARDRNPQVPGWPLISIHAKRRIEKQTHERAARGSSTTSRAHAAQECRFRRRRTRCGRWCRPPPIACAGGGADRAVADRAGGAVPRAGRPAGLYGAADGGHPQGGGLGDRVSPDVEARRRRLS